MKKVSKENAKKIKTRTCEVQETMVVALPFRYDLWSSSDAVKEDDLIDVHCLIPNGAYILLKVRSKTTLFELKEVRITESENSESCTCEKQHLMRH